MDQLILGRFVNRFDLGRFSMASNLSSVPWHMFVVPVMNPLTVSFSLVREDAGRLAAAYRKSSITIVALGLPVLVGMSATAEPLIRIALGDQWSGAAPLLFWLTLAAIPGLFVAPLAPLAIAVNRPSTFFRLALIEFLFKFPLMLLGTLYYGIVGVLVVRLATAFFVAGVSTLTARQLIQLPIRSQLLAPWRPALSTIIMLLAVLPFVRGFASSQDHVQLLLGLMWAVGFGAFVYAASLLLLWRFAGCPEGFESGVVCFLASHSRKLLRRNP
jgi:PST family polysaccharide transporter